MSAPFGTCGPHHEPAEANRPRSDAHGGPGRKTMKLLISAAVSLALAGAASAQTLDDLKNDPKNTDNILTYGMGYSQHRFSSLKQITKANVKRLVPVWSLSLDNQWGEQAQPIIYDGVMFVKNAKETVEI